MIRAAVRAAEGSGTPPPELGYYFKWRSWGVLPNQGGTRDQRAGELERMLACANVYEFWHGFKKGKLKLTQMTPEQHRLLKELKDLNGG